MRWLALLRTATGSTPAPRWPEALVWWALQFTPRVARLEEALVLELSASLRLFKGRTALQQRLLTELNELLGAGNAVLAWAPNSQAALALARTGAPGDILDGCPEHTPLAALLDRLPFPVLSQANAHAPLLARLGCRVLADLRRLPRAALARRTTPQLLRQLDHAYGQLGSAAEAHDWCVAPEQFEAKRELPQRTDDAALLQHHAEPLLRAACLWLGARHAGSHHIDFGWQYDSLRARSLGAWATEIQTRAGASCGANLGADEALDRTQQRVGNNEWPRKSPRPEGLSPQRGRFGVAPLARAESPGCAPRLASTPLRAQRGPQSLSPTLLGPGGSLRLSSGEAHRSLRVWQRLLTEHLNRLQLEAPVSDLWLRIDEAEPLQEASASLLAAGPDAQAADGESLNQLLQRLSVRLGPEQVQQAQPVADHRPEHQQRWQAWSASKPAPELPPPDPPAQWPQPSWLLNPPLQLACLREQPLYQGPLTLLAGPQRVESGWWDEAGTAARRDYFLAHSRQAGLLWLFRERQRNDANGWFLHGLFA